MQNNSKLQTIQVTIQDIWNVSKNTVAKNKKKYTRKGRLRINPNDLK